MQIGALLAFDRSLRRVDVDGRLHVESCNISKAMVCPYFGREIPDAETMRLDPDKVYYLLRDPAELAKAAPTFRGLPLLFGHAIVSADDPKQERVVGTTGTEVVFEPPYLKAPLVVWVDEAIKAIESKAAEQLSCAYRYRADMTPGTYEGVAYDGIMRDLVGNHVAIVEEGRAGPDVFVSDDLPTELKPMKNAATIERLRVLFAQDDADMDALDAEIEKLKAEDSDEEEEEEEEEKKKKAAKDKRAKDKAAKDAEMEEEERKAKDAGNANEPMKPEGGAEKPGMDSATVTRMTKAAEDSAVARVTALYEAKDAVRSIVGEVVGCDTAESVYAFALKHLGVDTAGVHPSAYPAMLKLARGNTAKPAPAHATDHKSVAATVAAFPGMSRIANL